MRPAQSVRGEWRRLLRFLRQPVLGPALAPAVRTGRVTGIGWTPLVAVLRIYLLDIALMLVLAIIAIAAVAAGVEFPDNKLNTLELTPWLIFAIIVGAPVTEEILFRSWLSGRPGHLAAAAAMGGAIFLLPMVMGAQAMNYPQGATNWPMLAIAGLVIFAAMALWFFRRRRPLRWFAWAFPAIFWIVSVLFGLVHLVNYDAGSLMVLVPLVVPQFVAGTMFGYVRLQYGLWAAILLHALHNGTAVAVMLLAGPVVDAA